MVLIVDPNKLNGGIPKYEEMYSFVELTAVRFGRSSIVVEGNKSNLTSEQRIATSFMGYRISDSGSEYTTSWSFNTPHQSDIYEGFGINNIKVTVNSSFVPQVTVDMVDVRGNLFFNKKVGKGNSPYEILYDFPPPMYRLKIKGAYGQPLVYELHQTKIKTNFDSETGNYLLNVEFVGRTFAPLTDIPFAYVTTFPYLNANNSKDIENVSASMTKEATNTYDLILKLKNLYDNTKLKNDIDSQNKILIDNGTKYSNFTESEVALTGNEMFKKQQLSVCYLDKSESITSFKSDSPVFNFKKAKFIENDSNISLIVRNAFNLTVSLPVVNNTPYVTGEWNDSTKKSVNNSVTQAKIAARCVNIKQYGYLNEYINTYCAAAISNINGSKNIVTSSDIRFMVYGYERVGDVEKLSGVFFVDISTLYEKLIKERNRTLENANTSRSQIKSIVDKNVDAIIGQKLTAKNIFTILCNDIDTFFEKMKKTAIDAQTHHNLDTNYSIISGDANLVDKKLTVFPYPYYVTKQPKSNIEVKTSPKALSNKCTTPFPEMTLVNDFITAYVKRTKLERLNNLKNEVDPTTSRKKWIPISPVELSISEFGSANTNPYANKTWDESLTVIAKRYLAQTQSFWGNSSMPYTTEGIELLKSLAYSEAYNMSMSIVESTKGKMSYLTQISNYLKDDNSILAFVKKLQSIMDSGNVVSNNTVQVTPTYAAEYNIINKITKNGRNLEIVAGGHLETTNSVADSPLLNFYSSKTRNWWQRLLGLGFEFGVDNIFVQTYENHYTDNMISNMLTNFITSNKLNELKNALENLDDKDRACAIISCLGNIFGIYFPKVLNDETYIPKAINGNYAQLFLIAYNMYITENKELSIRTGQNTNQFILPKVSKLDISDPDRAHAKSIIDTGKLVDVEKFNAKFMAILDTVIQNPTENYYKSELLDLFKPLLESKACLLSFNQTPTSGEERGPYGYIGIYGDDNVANHVKRSLTYFREFLTYLKSFINDSNASNDNTNKSNLDYICSDDDVLTETYYSLKDINDKWVNYNNPNGSYLLTEGKKLIDLFHFVDRGMNDIGDSVILNCEPLIDAQYDDKISIFSVISKLLSINGFEFFPLQNFMTHTNGEWENMFKTSVSNESKTIPAFVAMYIGGSSSHLRTNNENYNDDGFDLTDDIEANNNQTYTYGQGFTSDNIKAFRVSYGTDNQSYFKNFQIDSSNFVETNDSLAILSALAKDESASTPVPKSQNMFNLYENRAYKVTVEMLGNAMIQPTQYIQLDRIPLYSGAYLITGVEHEFVANRMTTTFSAVKVLKYPKPIVTEMAVSLGYDLGVAFNPLKEATLDIINVNDDKMNTLISLIIEIEGGDKVISDSGGVTKYGISYKAYKNELSEDDIRNLTLAKAIQLYTRDYYKPAKINEITDPKLAMQVLDHAVNAGLGGAISCICKVTGLNKDSKVTSQMIDRLNTTPDGATKYANARLAYYNSLKNRTANERLSWKRRVERIASSVFL